MSTRRDSIEESKKERVKCWWERQAGVETGTTGKKKITGVGDKRGNIIGVEVCNREGKVDRTKNEI